MNYARDLARYYDPYGELRDYYQVNDDQFLDLVAENMDFHSFFEDEKKKERSQTLYDNIMSTISKKRKKHR